MATQAFYDWDARGRPFRRPPWLTEQKGRARAVGVPFLGDLGNEAHLRSNNPEDHAPFSATAYPIPLPDYVICALDLGKGVHGDRILRDARAGRLPWLKYMNHKGKNYSRRRGAFAIPVDNPDDHLHLSGMSDHTYASSGTYDPYKGDPVPDNDVEETDENYQALIWRVEALAEGREKVFGGPRAGEPMKIVSMVKSVLDRPATVTMTPEDRAAIVDDIRGEIASVVEATIRRVLGGLDGVTP